MSEMNVTKMFADLTQNIHNRGVELTDKMNALSAQEGDIQPEDMIAIQFEIGQYNALLEATSTIMKSLVDEAKQIAQRAN